MINILYWEYQSEEEMVSRFLDNIPSADKNLVFTPPHLISVPLSNVDQSRFFAGRELGMGSWVWNETYKLWWIEGILPSWLDFATHSYRVIGVPNSQELAAFHKTIARSGEAIPYRAGFVPQLAIIHEGERLIVRPVFQSNNETLECASRELYVAPYLSIPRERFFLRNEIIEFEDLINSNPKESDVQRFLKTHDHFIKVLGFTEVRPHVVLRKSDSSVLIPDFLAHPIDKPFWDIVEIKAPVRNVIVKDRGSSALSSMVYRGINQLKEYAEYFSDQVQTKWFESENGIQVFRPQLILVVGASASNSLVDLQILRGRNPEVKIITYSELLTICKRYLLY